jgi:biotin-(acetyl-CoA carboxylase) ligase
MSDTPLLPPVYDLRLTPGADPTAAALTAAAAGDEEGALFWNSDYADLRCALLLTPEAPLMESLDLLTVAAVGVGDALTALAPPQIAVTFAWPNRILLNGGTVGRLTIAAEEVDQAQTPRWLVLSVAIDMTTDWEDDAPGIKADVTNLAEEGAGDIGQVELLEAICRHLLSWMARWQSEEGVAPARSSWRARATGPDKPFDPAILRGMGVLT